MNIHDMTEQAYKNGFEAGVKSQQYILMGVMHSVDKWLDSKELEQDEVNRAVTMREKTLRIVEEKQAEIERLQDRYERIMDALKAVLDERADHSEAIKEFADNIIHEIVNRPSEIQSTTVEYLNGSAYRQNEIIDIIEEMVKSNP